MGEMRIVYLTGERVYLRPLVLGDKDFAPAWHPGPFLIGAAQAENILKDEAADPGRRLALVRRQTDEVVGSVKLRSNDGFRRCLVTFHLAPSTSDHDALRAEALRVIVPWLRDQMEVMVVSVEMAGDEAETIAAAEELGMVLSVRLREFVARAGHRVDSLMYQALNPRWEVKDA
jgi:RimJ/RimL family protein N-acetyltransferase